MAHSMYVIASLFHFSGAQKKGREGEKGGERGGQARKGKPEI